MHTILHISDLHRSADEPVDNDSLLAALIVDRDRYLVETPEIPAPEAIIVSGDIVQGVPVGTSGWADKITEQYRVAERFLASLADRFLEGDRSRLVLIPGNHDVCWNTAMSSMEALRDDDYPPDIRRSLLEPGSRLRWSWKDRRLYRIHDDTLYKSRLRFYWDFVERFYGDASPARTVDRGSDFHVFELFDRRVAVVALDTTDGNDCFRLAGSIATGAVARAAMTIRDVSHSYELLLAVWHHSIHGGPDQDDYMSIDQVNEMVGLGFQLGLHGHQHRAEAATQVLHLGPDRSMAIVSAGSLCAGSRELPRGIDRQYNLIVVSDDLRTGRLHVREMTSGGQFVAKRNGAFVEGHVELTWQPQRTVGGNVVDAALENARRSIAGAEEDLHSGRQAEAVEKLRTVNLDEFPLARTLLIAALEGLKRWAEVESTIVSPRSPPEVVSLVMSLVEQRKFDVAMSVLGNADLPLDSATRVGLRDLVELRSR